MGREIGAGGAGGHRLGRPQRAAADFGVTGRCGHAARGSSASRAARRRPRGPGLRAHSTKNGDTSTSPLEAPPHPARARAGRSARGPSQRRHGVALTARGLQHADAAGHGGRRGPFRGATVPAARARLRRRWRRAGQRRRNGDRGRVQWTGGRRLRAAVLRPRPRPRPGGLTRRARSSSSSIANRAGRAGWPRRRSPMARCRRRCTRSWCSAAARCRIGWRGSSACATRSPQVLILVDGRAAWHTSHAGVTRDRVADGVAAAARRSPRSRQRLTATTDATSRPSTLAFARSHDLERRDQLRQLARREQDRPGWSAGRGPPGPR